MVISNLNRKHERNKFGSTLRGSNCGAIMSLFLSLLSLMCLHTSDKDVLWAVVISFVFRIRGNRINVIVETILVNVLFQGENVE